MAELCSLYMRIRTIASGCHNNGVYLGRKLHSKLPQKQTKVSFRFLKTNRALNFLREPIKC